MRWQQGQSGNPAGRPRRGRSLTELLRNYGRGRLVPGGPSRMQELVRVIWERALEGDRYCIKYILEHLEGRPVAAVPALPSVTVVVHHAWQVREDGGDGAAADAGPLPDSLPEPRIAE